MAINPSQTDNGNQFLNISVPINNDSAVEMKESLISIELPNKGRQHQGEDYEHMHQKPVKFRSQTQGPRRPNTSNTFFLIIFVKGLYFNQEKWNRDYMALKVA